MSRTIGAIFRKKSGWVPKFTKIATNSDSLWGRRKNKLLNNSNHRTAKAKTLTPPTSQKVRKTSRKRKTSYFYADLLHPEWALRIGRRFLVDEVLLQFLSNNLDVFAWPPTDMSGIDPAMICH